MSSAAATARSYSILVPRRRRAASPCSRRAPWPDGPVRRCGSATATRWPNGGRARRAEQYRFRQYRCGQRRCEPWPDDPVPTRGRGSCVRRHRARRIDGHLGRNAAECPRCERCAVIGHEWSVDAGVSHWCRCALGDPPDRWSLVPTISSQPVNQLTSYGLLVRSSQRFSTNGVVSACSDGGVPLAPKVLWGYGSSSQAGGLVVPAGAAYEALAADRVVRVDSNPANGVTFERSFQATRRVLDPQLISVFGTLQEQIAGTAQVAWGYSSASVIADVEARCQFATGIVKSSTTVWVDPVAGSGFNFHTVTDRLSQSTRDAVFCLPPYPTTGCDVRAIGVGPGGARFR